MKHQIITIIVLTSLMSIPACLNERDNPNDPGGVDNYFDGAPEFRVRQDTMEILDGCEYSIGSVAVGEYEDAAFYIDNTGDAYLDLTGMEMTRSDYFSVTQNPSTPVKPGKSTGFTIRFSPQSNAGEYVVVIFIHYIDEYNEEQVFSFGVKGRGI